MADVMQAMKKQKTTEDAPMLEILQKEAERTGDDFDTIYQGLQQGIKAGKMRIMRSGNTLLIYNIMQPGMAEFHISSLDDESKISKSLQDLYQAMKIAGFKTLTSTTVDAPIAQAISAAKIPVKVKQVPNTQGQSEYQLTIEVR